MGCGYLFNNTTPLNTLSIKAGRYLQANFSIKPNSIITTLPSFTTMSLNDSTFKTSQANYLLSTSYMQNVPFWISCACGTAPGYYLVNFNSSEQILFAPLAPIVVTVDTSSKGTITTQGPTKLPPANSLWIGITLSEPNFDQLSLTFPPQDTGNDSTAAMSSVTIPSGTIAPELLWLIPYHPLFIQFSLLPIPLPLPLKYLKQVIQMHVTVGMVSHQSEV